MKTNTSIATFAQPEIGPMMNGADCLVECLIREGVEVVFAYPGGASMEMHQSLTRRSDKLRTVLPRHEQGGAFAAEGYARATGKAGVCMATSGPGATNLVTAIADAYMDSIPMVAITGQVYQKYIGKSAFQETDFFGMTLPIVKHSYLVLSPHDLPRVIKEAFHIAQTGRPGPVLIDIPKDVQQAKFQPVFPKTIDLRAYEAPPHASDEKLKEVLALIAKAERPVLYVGGGIISSGAHGELLKFAELMQIPVTTTLMGVGCFPETHALSMKWLGMHGTVTANWAVDQSDLLLAFGVRFDDRVTGEVSKFATGATIVHCDIDASEFNKNKRVACSVHGEVRHALGRLCELASAARFQTPCFKEWHAKIDGWKRDYPFAFEADRHILAQEAVRVLFELTKGEAIVTTGVGQHQMWAAQFYDYHRPRSFISSLGLGAMGFGYPAALGAKVACPDRQVIDIDGDGSFLMNVQELATAKIEKIAAKVMILNNQHLGMVVQWEDRFYQANRGHTVLGDPDNIGGPENLGAIYPDYIKMAESFGVKSRRVVKREELRAAIQEMLDCPEAFVLDVIVPYTEHVLPMIPGGKTVKDMIIK